MRKKYYEIRKINKKKLILYKERRCSQMKPQLKVEKKMGAKRTKSLV